MTCYEARAWRRKQQRLNKERGDHDEGRERYFDVPFQEFATVQISTVAASALEGATR